MISDYLRCGFSRRTWLRRLAQIRVRVGGAYRYRCGGQSTELSQGAIQKQAKKLGLLNGAASNLQQSEALENLKAPAITCMACSLNRDGGIGTLPGVKGVWDNGKKSKNDKKDKKKPEVDMTGWESIVTGHGDSFARTWFWGKKRAGRWKFDTGDGKAVTVSNIPFTAIRC